MKARNPLRELRLLADMTLLQASAAVGISATTLRNVEIGFKRFDMGQSSKLVDVYRERISARLSNLSKLLQR